MNSAKLLALATHIRMVPPELFRMSVWRAPCGSAACAIGHGIAAGLLPELELTRHPRSNGFLVRLRGAEDLGADDWDSSNYNFSAVAQVFEISEPEAEFLFGVDNYPTIESEEEDPEVEPADRIPPEWVADQIEQFVRDGGMPEELR